MALGWLHFFSKQSLVTGVKKSVQIKRIMISYLPFFVATPAFEVFKGTEVMKLNNGVHNNYTVDYSLPITLVAIILYIIIVNYYYYCDVYRKIQRAIINFDNINFLFWAALILVAFVKG